MLFAEILMLALIYSQLQACAKNAVLAQKGIRLDARNATTVTCSDIFGDCCALKFGNCQNVFEIEYYSWEFLIISSISAGVTTIGSLGKCLVLPVTK